MAFLCRYGHVSPSEYSEGIRRHGLSWAQARRLEGELVKLVKNELEMELTLAKIRAGLPVR